MPESDEEIPVESNDDTPIIAEDAETMEVGVVEEQDPLEAALARAETAEKEIAYKDAEIQNIRKRFLANMVVWAWRGKCLLYLLMLTAPWPILRKVTNHPSLRDSGY